MHLINILLNIKFQGLWAIYFSQNVLLIHFKDEQMVAKQSDYTSCSYNFEDIANYFQDSVILVNP